MRRTHNHLGPVLLGGAARDSGEAVSEIEDLGVALLDGRDVGRGWRAVDHRGGDADDSEGKDGGDLHVKKW